MIISYEDISDRHPEEATRRLDKSFDLLFNAVLEAELKPKLYVVISPYSFDNSRQLGICLPYGILN